VTDSHKLTLTNVLPVSVVRKYVLQSLLYSSDTEDWEAF